MTKTDKVIVFILVLFVLSIFFSCFKLSMDFVEFKTKCEMNNGIVIEDATAFNGLICINKNVVIDRVD